MKIAVLTRTETSDEGTFGTLVTGSGHSCVTVELPWRDNLPEISCIPCGVYLCEWAESPKFGECYHLRHVPGRTDILIHEGNWGGDVKMNFRRSVKGCIAPGEELGRIKGQKAVVFSTSALYALEMDLMCRTFTLTIR